MTLAADIVLFIHFGIVTFIVSGFFLIPLGYRLHWRWPSNRPFRLLHTGMMLAITIETLMGITCPLTHIENQLRGANYQESFMGYWVGKVVYWNLPPHFFMGIYCLCLGMTLVMWVLFPPENKLLK